MEYTTSMHHKATYWPPGQIDEFGQYNFLDVLPELIDCRWQDDAVLFRSATGEEKTSQAVVYPEKQLSVRGYLAYGDLTDQVGVNPREIESAFEIQQVGRTASLDGLTFLNKVYL